MATEVLMPKLGLTMTEGTIEEWKIKEGQPVKKGDVLFTVATDKLTNDVEADADGVLLKVLLPEGETGACKSVIAYIGAEGETVPDIASAVEPASTVATDLIAEGALAIRLEATVDELISTIHSHPTVTETMREAALNLEKRAIHTINK